MRESASWVLGARAVWVITAEALHLAHDWCKVWGMTTTKITETEQLERAFDAPDTVTRAKMDVVREMYLEAVERGEIEPDEADESYEAALDVYHGYYR